MAQSSEPVYLEVARRKQAQLDSGILMEWRLPAGLIPAELGITEDWDVWGLLAQMRQGMLSAEDVVRAFSKGVDSCIGLTALAFKLSTSYAWLVTMLLSLGAVIIAKMNVLQGMAAPDSYNHVFGCMLNPLNHQLTVGGSSGGEAALVAMRGSMVGFGTDIGGSIRVLAMCTGLYGFKLSVGRIPFGGVVTGQLPGLGRVSL
ncbi:hypothetical protein CNMCM8686_001073 [Aspergillus fumigatus]|nr:hypothetical protein CNMCM8686_001073 [Aspergillus fumigatus]